MGEYARPRNPQTVPSTKIRVFDGIGGPPTQILKRFNFKGWDLSNTVANDVRDLHLSEKGSALLRPGERRLSSEDYTIGWIGQMTIGGLLRYGTIYNNGLTMIDLPMQMGYDLIEWPEDDAARPSYWPVFWPWPGDPVDAVIPEDPSLPIEEQVCEIWWECTASPATLSFTMPYAATITPTSRYWYDQVEGYRPNTPLQATYNVDAEWFTSRIPWVASWVVAPCKGIQAGALLITPTGKDSDGDWLTPGTHTYTKTLTISDGTLLECAVSMIVLGPAITLTPTSDSLVVFHGAGGDTTSVVSIKNTGDAGSTLNWENSSITGDAVLTAILSLDTSSGALAKSASENVTITLTNPSSLAVGTYNAVVTFRDQLLTSETETFDVALEVRPPVSDNFYCWPEANKGGKRLTAVKQSTNTWQTSLWLPWVQVYWIIKIDEATAQVKVSGGSCVLPALPKFSQYEIISQTGVNASGVPIAEIRATGVPDGLPVNDRLYLGEV